MVVRCSEKVTFEKGKTLEVGSPSDVEHYNILALKGLNLSQRQSSYFTPLDTSYAVTCLSNPLVMIRQYLA